jgi:N-methylhydantoinase A/acetone carboxylase beta subunit
MGHSDSPPEPRVIAYDAGGTMTDCFVVGARGEFVVGKAQTTPDDESRGLIASTEDGLGLWGTTLEQALPSMASGVFSGTAMLNRLLERKGLRVGCLVSAGMEDYLRLERGLQTWLGMTYSDRLHVITHHHNEPLVPIERMKGIRGRIDVQGREAIPLYEDDVRRAVAELIEMDVEAVVICFLQAFIEPSHEERAARIAKEVLDSRGVDIPVLASSGFYALRGDFPRLNSTLIEAYAAEPSRHQFEKLRSSLSERGASFELRIMAAHGGTIAVESKELARTLVSGPIGGVVGAHFLCDEIGIERAVCSDIGGTSFDLALINEGELAIRQTPDIGRFLLNLPMVEIESIGAGTGSAVRIDPSSNRPEIGPDSAGARIGTAWPDGGFETATVTDLNLVLGRLDPDNFLGGQVSLDIERARAEVRRQIADPLGLDLEAAAGGIVELFEEQLRYAALARVLGKGYTPVDHVLFCYGGGGPLHVAGYTRGAGYADVLVPSWAAGFSAFGCACADFSYRFDQTIGLSVKPGDDSVTGRLRAAWKELAERGYEAFERSGIPRDRVAMSPRLRMQYSGQLNDIEVKADDPDEDLTSLISRFEALYGRIYAEGATSPELGYTATSVSVVASSGIEKPKLPFEDLAGEGVTPEPQSERLIWWSRDRGQEPSAVFSQDLLLAGHEVSGPAVIESPTSTFAIPPGRSARLDERRIFHLSEKGDNRA